MKRTVLALFAVGVLIAADDAKEDANKKDLEKMQGDWACVSWTVDGKKQPDDDAQSIFRNVKGNQYTLSLFNKALDKGTFKIDATKKPKTMDGYPSYLEDKSKPVLGIYEFDGDTLKTCFAMPGKERPTDFKAKEGSGHSLSVWEREKK
jgi:uncharacterized protein (TIGR03067 family)